MRLKTVHFEDLDQKLRLTALVRDYNRIYAYAFINGMFSGPWGFGSQNPLAAPTSQHLNHKLLVDLSPPLTENPSFCCNVQKLSHFLCKCENVFS